MDKSGEMEEKRRRNPGVEPPSAKPHPRELAEMQAKPAGKISALRHWKLPMLALGLVLLF